MTLVEGVPDWILGIAVAQLIGFAGWAIRTHMQLNKLQAWAEDRTNAIHAFHADEKVAAAAMAKQAADMANLVSIVSGLAVKVDRLIVEFSELKGKVNGNSERSR